MKATFVLSVLIFFFISAPVKAQKLIDDTKVIKVLMFENEHKDKKKMINQTARIKYKLRSDSKHVYKGTLDDIKEGVMVVDGQEVLFNDCSMIAGRVFSEELLIGGVCSGTGLTTIIFGAALAGNIIVGGTIVTGGLALLIAGIVMVTKVKRFKLDKGWEVHSAEIIYNAVD
jgi:hypothetical protein